MPPQQRERLLDLIDERLDFGAQDYLRQDDRSRSQHVSDAAGLGKRRLRRNAASVEAARGRGPALVRHFADLLGDAAADHRDLRRGVGLGADLVGFQDDVLSRGDAGGWSMR
jgi:hypothetical protein